MRGTALISALLPSIGTSKLPPSSTNFGGMDRLVWIRWLLIGRRRELGWENSGAVGIRGNVTRVANWMTGL